MKGEDKMKQTIMGIGLIVGVLAGFVPSVDAQTQKKPVDIEACMSWKRVESPDISPTGRWVTYRIAPMEYNPENTDAKTVHLFDTRTRKEILLDDVENIEFYNSDQALSYQKADSTGNMKTILMELPSGIKKEWKYKESFRPVNGTPYSVSVTNVPKDTVNHVPSFNRLVVRHLKTGTAFQIDSIGYYTLYNEGRSIIFVRRQAKGNALCYGPLTGPYQTIYQSAVKKEPVSFSLDTKLMTGEFSIKDSLWYNFSLKKNTCDLVFDRKEVILPAGMELARATLSHSQKFLTMELRPYQEKVNKDKKEEEVKPDKSFELELWTWDEYEVPTLQTRGRYFRPQYSKYIYDIASGKLTEVAPGHADLLEPDRAEEIHYVLYTDETPYRMQKEWLNEVPFDIYSVNVHTGKKQLVGRSYRTRPKWSMNGKWAVMYDPVAQVWNKFDGTTGKVYNNAQFMAKIDFSTAIPTSYRFIASISTFDYFKKDKLFSRNDKPAFNQKDERFLKLQVGLPFLSSKRAEFGIGIARIEDKYFQKSVIDFGNDKFDKSRYDLFGGSISFNGSTLNSRQYPTRGYREALIAQIFIGRERFYPGEGATGNNNKEHHSWLQLSYMKEKYHNMSEHWVLGWYLKALYASKNFSENYTATMMQAGEFSPTQHSKLTYNEAFRANQFVGAGIRPIYRLNQMFHLRGEFYGFMPIYPIERNSLNKAYYGKAFSKFEYLGEISVVCQLPFGDISAYVNHYSSPKREWNVGLSIGWQLFNYRFIE